MYNEMVMVGHFSGNRWFDLQSMGMSCDLTANSHYLSESQFHCSKKKKKNTPLLIYWEAVQLRWIYDILCMKWLTLKENNFIIYYVLPSYNFSHHTLNNLSNKLIQEY